MSPDLLTPCYIPVDEFQRNKHEGYIIGYHPNSDPWLYYLQAPEREESPWYTLFVLEENNQYRRYRFRAHYHGQALMLAKQKLESLHEGKHRRDAR